MTQYHLLYESGVVVEKSERLASTSSKEDEEAKKSPKEERKKRFFLAVIAVVVVIGGIYLFLTRNEVETDDAFTAGRAIMIAPHVAGYIVDLKVNDNQFVREGQVLAVIEPRDWAAKLDRAQGELAKAQASLQASNLLQAIALLNYPGQLERANGQLEIAKAELFRAQTDYTRQHKVLRAATSQQDLDYAKAQLDSARGRLLEATGEFHSAQPVEPNIKNAAAHVSQEEAELKIAQAQLRLAQLNMEWTTIKAPRDGWISQRNVELGTYVHEGQNLFSIVEPEIWVTANYKETQITKMLPGQKVDIYVDAYPHLRLHGHIDSIQKGTGATFSAFPPENATGNYVKIVQRVPIKIMIDDGLDPDHPMSLGLSVEPVVHVDTPGRSDRPPEGVPVNAAQGIL